MGNEFHAYIDESGGHSGADSALPHFLMGAVVVRKSNMHHFARFIEELRVKTGRRSGERLHWRNFKKPEQRRELTRMIGAQSVIRAATVIVCKPYMQKDFWKNTTHQIHLETLGVLLERISWLAYRHDGRVSYTLAHIPGLEDAHIAEFEDKIRAQSGWKIRWDALGRGSIGYQPSEEGLQVADLVVSATANAFNPPPNGKPTEPEWLHNMLPLFAREGGDLTTLTMYALRFNPSYALGLPQYQWVRELERAGAARRP